MIMYYAIIIVLLFVIYGSFNLSRKDYRVKNVCPKVLGIPACYLVFFFFVASLVAHLTVGDIPYYYYAAVAVPFLLALSGSSAEMMGKKVCPRTANGTPMCFISLGFCTALLAMKFFS